MRDLVQYQLQPGLCLVLRIGGLQQFPLTGWCVRSVAWAAKYLTGAAPVGDGESDAWNLAIAMRISAPIHSYRHARPILSSKANDGNCQRSESYSACSIGPLTDWKITFADTVADNGSPAFYVLRSEHTLRPGLDLWTCGMVMEINDEVASLGAGAARLGHPLNALTWLASTLAECDQPLRVGQVVLTGVLGPMVTIKPGDRVRANIGGLGSVSVTFRDDRL